MNTIVSNPCKVITGRQTVFAYLCVNEPRIHAGGGAPKYSVSLIIPKSDTLTVEKVKAAIRAAYEEGLFRLRGSDWAAPALEGLRSPLRDGDLERPGDPAYRDSWFINASSTHKPGVVDADRNKILDSSELYSGITGRASITFYAYNANGSRGIGCCLNNLQKLADGTPLGGHSRAEDDFAD